MKRFCRIRRRSLLLFALLLALLSLTSAAEQKQSGQKKETLKAEETRDYYQNWLDRDVKYIITPEERNVFEKLTTEEEREQFIEQFWFRRDPSPATALNEFKEEHYRRIAYANEQFQSGYPGWMTDRGRVYIIHGPPDEIESYPAGGSYRRPMHEGGGITQTFPFEIWRYRYLEGVGSDIELEFVDSTQTREFRLTADPFEKDALARTPGAGKTMLEELGLAHRGDRDAYTNPTLLSSRPWIQSTLRAKDEPFQRYATLAKVQKPAQITFKDLKEIIDVDISYDSLPLRLREDHIKLNEQQVLVPVTLSVNNRELGYRLENGAQVAKLAIYGTIKGMSGQIIQEFEEERRISILPELFRQALRDESLYQRVFSLDRRSRYKLNLVVKDTITGKVGVVQRALIPPPFEESRLALSSLILSKMIKPLPAVPQSDQMFVLGDVEVYPSIDRQFSKNEPIGVYLQVYGAAFDQSSSAPSLRTRFRILQQGRLLVELSDESGQSIQSYSTQRIVLIHRLPTNPLEAGQYELEVEIEDRISGQSCRISQDFTLVEALGK